MNGRRIHAASTPPGKEQSMERRACAAARGTAGGASRQTRRQAGAVAIMAAFTLVGLIGICGLAVDLGRMFVVRAELDKAVDGAALAGARLMPLGHGPAQEAARALAGESYDSLDACEHQRGRTVSRPTRRRMSAGPAR